MPDIVITLLAVGSCFLFAAFLVWNEQRAAKRALAHTPKGVRHEDDLPPLDYSQFNRWEARAGEHEVNRGSW